MCPQLLQSCLTLDCSPPGSFVHGDSLGKKTGVGCHAFLPGTFPTQGSISRLISSMLTGRFFTSSARAHSHFPETVSSLPARAPGVLANTVILLVGALGVHFFSFHFSYWCVFFYWAAKPIICITSLFIIYGETQISRVLYDCYLICSAPWNMGRPFSSSCLDLTVDFRAFSQACSSRHGSYQEACWLKQAGGHLDHRSCQAPSRTSFHPLLPPVLTET